MTAVVSASTTRTAMTTRLREVTRRIIPTGRAPSDLMAEAAMRTKKAARRRMPAKTSVPMRSPGTGTRVREGEGGEARSGKKIRPRGALAERRTFRLRPCAGVAQLLAAGNTLLGDEPLQHQLARCHHRQGVFLAREAYLLDQVEQARHHAEPLEARFGALVDGDLQGAALVEPLDDVVHVGPAHACLEGASRGAADQLLGDQFRTLQFALVLELELTSDGRQRRVHV